MNYKDIKKNDLEIYKLIKKEEKRQIKNNAELIASENYASYAVMEAAGSILTNKYAEGYPNKRYYGGCQYIDKIETIAIERLKKLFNVKYANVQPHSGSQANMAAIRSVLNHGDTILGMSLDAGGHLTHGYKLSFSGQDYNAFFYGVDPITHEINYDEVLKLAKQIKPKLIICGASAYPRNISFKKFKEIANEVNAYLLADIAHIAGLIVAGYHESPVGYADIITSTTHKTLRGPRGGIIMTNNEELAKKIDKTLFPGCQGGPLENIIGAKAVCFKEASSNEYKLYIKHVVENAKAMANEFIKLGYKVITNGTDNHLILLDIKSSKGLNGLQAQNLLEKVNITCNKNTIPNDTERPMFASGLRLGTPALTSRGFKKEDFIKLVHLIDKTFNNKDNKEILKEIKKDVTNLVSLHPYRYEFKD